MMDKKALSPLIATVLLVAFAVALGAVVMSWTAGAPEEVYEANGCLVHSSQVIDPLAKLQVQYIRGEISRAQYLVEEQKILSK